MVYKDSCLSSIIIAHKYAGLVSTANSFHTWSNYVIFSAPYLKVLVQPASSQGFSLSYETSACHCTSAHLFCSQNHTRLGLPSLSTTDLMTPQPFLCISTDTKLVSGPQSQSLKQFSFGGGEHWVLEPCLFLPQWLCFLVSTLIQAVASSPHPAGEPQLPCLFCHDGLCPPKLWAKTNLSSQKLLLSETVSQRQKTKTEQTNKNHKSSLEVNVVLRTKNPYPLISHSASTNLEEVTTGAERCLSSRAIQKLRMQ